MRGRGCSALPDMATAFEMPMIPPNEFQVQGTVSNAQEFRIHLYLVLPEIGKRYMQMWQLSAASFNCCKALLINDLHEIAAT